MKLILKYLKPFAVVVLLCLALLFGQAICDLSLPNLMSDIVNTGIQLGGIEEGAPKILSENGFQLVQFFMTGSDRDDFSAAYTRKEAGTAGEKKYTCSDNGFPFVPTSETDVATPTQDYGSIYITGYATNDSLCILTYDVDANGNQTLIDKFERKLEVCSEH